MTDKELFEILNDLRSLIAETEVVEFEEVKNGSNFDKIGKYFSALSNGANLKCKHFGFSHKSCFL